MIGCLMDCNDAQCAVDVFLQPSTTDCSGHLPETFFAVWVEVIATPDGEIRNKSQHLCEGGTQGVKLTSVMLPVLPTCH